MAGRRLTLSLTTALVEGTNAKNVIDVPLSNEAGAVLAADSGTLFDNREITNNGSVQIASGSLLELVAVKLSSGTGATIAPQISGPSTFGKIALSFGSVLQAGGTRAPMLTGGYTPGAGAEFDVIEGATLSGTFGAVSGGFAADYSHEAASPSYVGVVYGAAPSGPSTPGKTVATPRVTSITGGAGKLLVKLSCPAGTNGCTSATVKLTVVEHLKGGRVTAVSAKAKRRTKLLVIAIKSVSLPAGRTVSLSLTLNGTGARLLKKYRRLQALATVSAGARKLRTQTVTITAAKTKPEH